MAAINGNFSKRLIAIIVILGLLAFASLWLYGQIVDHWIVTRPSTPVIERGLVVRLESHGAVFYVSESEEMLANALEFSPFVFWGLILIIFAIRQFAARKNDG